MRLFISTWQAQSKVPVENLLGEREGGFKMALTILNGGRIKVGSGAVGGAINGLDRAVKFAKERKQFKVPIATFGAIQYKIGDIAMRIFANQAACFRTADLLDKKLVVLKSRGLADGTAKIKAITEFAIEASIVKIKGSELVCYALDEAIQIHGGMGYAMETGLGMGYRDARITKIYEGTNDINAMLAVGELSKRGMVTKELELMGAGKRIPGFLLSQLNPFRSKSDDKEQARIVKGLKYSFLYISGMAGKKLKKKLIEEQEIILNLSTLLQEAYVGDTALLKIKKLRGMPDADKKKLKIQEQMVQLYLYEALEKSKKAALEAVASFSKGSEKRKHTRMVCWMLKSYDINPKILRRNIAQPLINQGFYDF